MLPDPYTALAAATLLFAALSMWQPRWAMSVLLVFLPFFTQHPGTTLARWLVLLVATIELTYLFRARPSWKRTWTAISGQPLLLVSAAFVCAAFLSLSSLPLSDIWREHAAAATGLPLSAWPGKLLDWMGLPEVRPEFSITSAVLTLQGFLFALILWRQTRASTETAVQFARALTLGMVVFVAAGLLEVAGVVSLEPLRGTGLVAYRVGALQSASGNPGWFTEYLVYTLPYALVLLAGRKAAGLGLVLLAGVIALTAFALLVGFQRGGWVSGTLVILYIAASVPRLLNHRGAPGLVPRRQVRSAVALVAVVAVVVPAGFWLWTARDGAGGARLDRGAYVGRLKSIASGDRLAYLDAGVKIAMLHPILGGGHESFAYRYGMYFQSPGGPYQLSQVRVPDPASAHSVYVQTLTGTGGAGLALLVTLFVLAAWTTVCGLRVSVTDERRRVVLLATSGSLLGVACYGLVQEVFYIHALRLLFFAGIGVLAGAAADGPVWSPRAGRTLWLALATTFAVHLGYEHAWPGPGRLLISGDPTGVYGEEPGPRDTHFEWTTNWATWPVPSGATGYSLQVRSLAPFQQEVELQPCHGRSTRVTLSDHAWHPIEGTFDGCGAGDRLHLHVAPAWRPPRDGRLLGVMTADLKFLRPSAGGG